jgi:hypothetical protein
MWKGILEGDITIEFDAVGRGEFPFIQATICDNGKGENYLFGVGVKILGPPRNQIMKYNKSGTNEILSKESGKDIKVGTKYHIKVEKTGSTLRLWIDGDLHREIENAEYAGGHVGLFAGGSDRGVQFDNVKITGKISGKWLSERKRRQ